MIVADANIRAVITARDEASKTLQKFGDNTSDTLAQVTKAAKYAAVAIGATLATAVVAAAKASYDQVDAVQQATIALKAYEKDGDKVNAVLKDLIGYARSDLGVLFNRKDLFQSAQSLKLMGDNTADLVSHVKILSRSVGLGLSNWEELNLIVGRVGSTGRLTGEDFDNLTKAGYKLAPSLRNTNITFSELFKALDKGIPTDALDGQANTIKGLTIRLQTAFRGVGDAILGVDSETSKFVKGGLGDLLTRGIAVATEKLKEFSAVIREVAPVIQETLIQALNTLTPVMDQLGQAMNRVNESFAKLNREHPGLVEGLRILAGIIGTVFIKSLEAVVFTQVILINMWAALISSVNAVANAFRSMGYTAAGVAMSLVGPFKAAFNAIASLWNNTVGKLSFRVPSWVPSLGGKGWDVPDVPMLAEGGIVTKPTLAMIGERGPEAVVPLNKARGAGQTNIVVNIGLYAGTQMEKRRIAQELMSAYNDAKGMGTI